VADAVKPTSFLEALKTVLSGFIGIRSRSGHERAPVGPLQILVAAVAFAMLLVFALVAIVRVVTG